MAWLRAVRYTSECSRDRYVSENQIYSHSQLETRPLCSLTSLYVYWETIRWSTYARSNQNYSFNYKELIRLIGNILCNMTLFYPLFFSLPPPPLSARSRYSFLCRAGALHSRRTLLTLKAFSFPVSSYFQHIEEKEFTIRGA